MANNMGMPKGGKCIGWRHPGGNYTVIDYAVDEKGLGRIRIHCHVDGPGCTSDHGGWKRKTDFSNAGENSSGAESCGCLKRKIMSEKMLDHGDSLSSSPYERLYGTWKNIKTRCKPDFDQHADYFDKGIRVCDEWENDYEAFKWWALDNGWEKGLTLERKNNHCGYNPENCCWASRQEQARSTSRNRRYTWQGETKILVDWALDHRCKVEYNTLLARLDRYGWEFERALTTPSRNQGSSSSISSKARNIYHAMMSRCYNPEGDPHSFARYGGRGIGVCEEWRGNPDAYIAWYLDNYIERHDVDRKNNDLGYSPQNCHFVSRGHNNNNRANTTLLSFEGRILGAAQWAKLPEAGKGVTAADIRRRKKSGWSDQEAIAIRKGMRRPASKG
jgi:hypothetical protein